MPKCSYCCGPHIAWIQACPSRQRSADKWKSLPTEQRTTRFSETPLCWQNLVQYKEVMISPSNPPRLRASCRRHSCPTSPNLDDAMENVNRGPPPPKMSGSHRMPSLTSCMVQPKRRHHPRSGLPAFPDVETLASLRALHMLQDSHVLPTTSRTHVCLKQSCGGDGLLARRLICCRLRQFSSQLNSV